jgi:hypothetical protein
MLGKARDAMLCVQMVIFLSTEAKNKSIDLQQQADSQSNFQ